ncbi:MAG: hypothetical protein WAM52_16665 [Steroidobacteraceae bacterium]
MKIRCTVWGEAIHERESPLVAAIYPDGMHHTIAAALQRDPQLEVVTTEPLDSRSVVPPFTRRASRGSAATRAARIYGLPRAPHRYLITGIAPHL